MISRAVAGIGETLIINLPGSPRGRGGKSLFVWPAVPHAVAKIKGDPRSAHRQSSPDIRPSGRIAVFLLTDHRCIVIK